MTEKDLKIDREDLTEILNSFLWFGINDLKSFALQAIDIHKLSPRGFYFIMISLLESFMKYFSSNCDRNECKEIFNEEARQEIVNCFFKALSESSTKFEHI